MTRRFLLLFLVFLAILVLHYAIITRGLYNRYWWLDIVLHTFGGMWVGGVYVFLRSSTRLVFWRVFLFALTVGIFWEILEFVFNTPFFGVDEAHFSNPLWVLDTLSDLFVDVVASLAFVGFIRLNQIRWEKTHA